MTDNLLKKLYLYLDSKKPIPRFFILLLLGYLIALASSPLSLFFTTDITKNSPMEAAIDINLLVMVVLAAPIFETFVFQYLIYDILYLKFLKRINRNWIFILSAVLFAFNHKYNWGYIVFAFFAGLYLIICYDYFRYARKDAFWNVVLLHALRNLISFSIIYLIKNFY